MTSHFWKLAALMSLVVAACFVPTLGELEEEKTWSCDSEHPCQAGHSCVEGRCQANEGTACRNAATSVCGLDTGECQPGTRSCGADSTYGPCTGAVLPGAEVCNNKDDDCDGKVDEDLSCGDGGDPCAECTQRKRTCTNGACGRCLDEHFEIGDRCSPKLSRGENCANSSMCSSGYCVDGVCCESACAGACEQCDATPGSCTASADGSSGTPSCEPYRCDGISRSCPIRCAGDQDCAPGVLCVNNRCGDKLPNGTACTVKEQCASGNCVDNVCCNAAVCNDGRACTRDVCDSSGMCNYSQFCPMNQACSPSGACECSAPYTLCNGNCIDTASDIYNCGSCGRDCTQDYELPPGYTAACRNRACVCLDQNGNQANCPII